MPLLKRYGRRKLPEGPKKLPGAEEKRPAEPAIPNEYWKVSRVARTLDITPKRVYQLVQERRLDAIRLGARQLRITRRSLDGYLARLHAEHDQE